MSINFVSKNLFNCSFLKVLTILILISEIISIFAYVWPEIYLKCFLIIALIILVTSYFIVNLIDVTDSEI